MKFFGPIRQWAVGIPSSRSEKLNEQLNLKFGRRSASVAILSLIAAIGATVTARPAKAAEQSHPKARIAAPKDCFVVEVFPKDNHPISFNDKIAILDSEDEDRGIERISLAMQFIALQEECIFDSPMNIRREILQSTLEVARAYLQYARLRIDDEYSHMAGGTSDGSFNLRQGMAAQIRAEAEVNRASSALDLFDFNVSQARQKLGLIKAAIPKEQAALTIKKNRLNLISPVTGRVSLHCYKGSFLKKGDVLAEIF